MKIVVVQNKWLDTAEANFNNITRLIGEACQVKEIDFICLPEYFLGPPWFHPGQSHLKEITDDTIPGCITDRLCGLAKKYHVYLIAGTFIEKINDTYYNTSVFINRKGELVGKAQKVHLFASETINCSAGKEFKIFETEFGKVGIAVCSDFWIIETCRILALEGAKMIFVPGGSLRKNIKSMAAAAQYTALANNLLVILASPVGKVIGKRNKRKIEITYSGYSLVASPEKLMGVAALDEQDILKVELNNRMLNDLSLQKEKVIHSKNILNQNDTASDWLLNDYIYKDRDLSEYFKLKE